MWACFIGTHTATHAGRRNTPTILKKNVYQEICRTLLGTILKVSFKDFLSRALIGIILGVIEERVHPSA